MKKLIFVIASIVLSLSMYAQVDAAIDDKVNKAIDIKLAAFAKRLDSSITVFNTTAGSFMVDSIKPALNTSMYCFITLIGEYGNTKVQSIKAVMVSNKNGIYSIGTTTNVKSFSGLTGGGFDVMLSNNGVPYVRITGTSIIVKWTYKRTNI